MLAQGEHPNWPVDVQTELDENLPPVTADRVQLQHVMFNLITNAIDAIGFRNRSTPILGVKSELNGVEGVIVTVEDSGTGISASRWKILIASSILSSPPSLTAWGWVTVTREPRRRLRADRPLPRFEPCLPRPAREPPGGPGWPFRPISRRKSGRTSNYCYENRGVNGLTSRPHNVE